MRARLLTSEDYKVSVNYAIDKTPKEIDGYVQETCVDSRVVDLVNAWVMDCPPAFMNQGFELTNAPVQFQGLPSEQSIKAAYPKIEQCIESLTRGAVVYVFDHTIRNSESLHSGRKPIFLTHADYSDEAGFNRLRELYPDDFEFWCSRRFMIVNLWQPLVKLVCSSPLAFIDIRTVESADFVPITVKYKGRSGSIGYYKYNPDHRWYWFPLMENDEAVVFKTFDSKPGNGHWSCPHSAVQHQYIPGNTERASIEFRAFVLLEPEANA